MAERKRETSSKKPMPASPKVPAAVAAEMFERLNKAYPDAHTELEFVNDYTLLVAVVLSAQATDAGVNRATRPLFEKVQTPQAMLALGLEGLRGYIHTIGLYNSKAQHVMELSAQLLERHGGKVPADREALMALSGVGRKTANVVLNQAFGQATMPVDTHVFRVAHRMGLSDGKTPLAVEQDLLPLVPPELGQVAHHLLVLHGRYLCKARIPECWRCPIEDICPYEPKTPAPGVG